MYDTTQLPKRKFTTDETVPAGAVSNGHDRSMSKPRPSRSPTSGRILAQIVSTLERIDAGCALSDIAVPGTDRRILHNSVLTILRHRAVIDWMIDRLARRRVRPRLRRVLRWAVSQLAYMCGLPASVVTDTAVRFVKRRYDASEAHFINALLRELVAAPVATLLERARTEAPAYVRLELGEELHAKWSARFTEPELETLAAVLLQPASVVVRTRADAKSAEDLPYLAPLAAPAWAPGARIWTCTDPAGFFACDAFARGDFYVQDPATLLAPWMLGVQPGERVTDLCAAPGGKSLVLAEQLGGRGSLLCLDRSRQRMKRLRQNLAGVASCFLAVGDAEAPPLVEGEFDAVMLDVPCSNTGVVRRRPDVRWHFSLARLEELVQVQGRILSGAARLLKPGGRLVYSTCSIELEENSRQVRCFLQDAPDFRLTAEVEILPAANHDGAYAALLARGV